MPGSLPRVLPSSEHPITLEQIDRDALTVLRRLGEAGFAAYLVGGGVRDLYLGTVPKDFDISTDARPGQIRKLFRNSRTIGSRFRLAEHRLAAGYTGHSDVARRARDAGLLAADRRC